MKTRHYSTEQIISTLKEADSGIPVKDLYRQHGLSDATIDNWKSKYGSMTVSEAKRNAVRHLHEHFGRRFRKLCMLIGLSRTSWHDKPKPDTHEPVRQRLWELADEQKRRKFDNAPAFIGKALDAWAHRHGVKLVFNRPGKPVDNTSIREIIGQWQEDDNSIRPHSSSGRLIPEELMVQQTDFYQKEVVL
ncbi:transposase [Chlorobaculum sp. MV4-Y]|uniref:transposase n=1 Tax=Chlorobaculum sp. MV4-Y TaxID=2976335 RepID=UPI0021AF726B|nr:transposase [Chlorobaculum sp. MV4-Y]UWX58528.1 transposase [Chlorobaculum sp. MV4-Y]